MVALGLGLVGVLLVQPQEAPAPLGAAELSAVVAGPRAAGTITAVLNLSLREGQASNIAAIGNVAANSDPGSVSQARTQLAVRVTFVR